MRAILIFCFVFFGTTSYSQTTLTRAKVNVNYGFSNYSDFGMSAQFERYFTVALYASKITEKLRVKNPTDQPVYNTLLNRGTGITIYAGVSTEAPSKIYFTGLAGVSFGEYNVHDNIEIEEHSSGSLYVTSSFNRRNLLGIGFRGEMTFVASKRIGLNIGLLGAINPKFGYFRVYIGISIGKMGTR